MSRARTPERPLSTGEHRAWRSGSDRAAWQREDHPAVFDHDDELDQLISVGRDGTDPKDPAEARMESERRLRAVFEQSREFMAILDADGCLLQANRATTDLVAPEGRARLGAPFWKQPWFRSRRVREGIERAVRQCVGGEAASLESEHYTDSGERRVHEGAIRPIRDEQGRIVLLFAHGDDVTERIHLEREIAEIGARERQRIGQDLHDSLGQRLTAVGFLAKALQEELDQRGMPEAEDAAAIKAQVTSALRDVRRLSQRLLPVTLGSEGLEGALRDLAIHTTEVFSIDCVLQVDRGTPEVCEEVAADLLQIAREAITNAVRHGQATRVEIGLSYDRRGLALTILDDGLGMAPGPLPRGGLGFRIMGHRAARIGASFEVSPGPREGTIVTCILPAGCGGLQV